MKRMKPICGVMILFSVVTSLLYAPQEYIEMQQLTDPAERISRSMQQHESATTQQDSAIQKARLQYEQTYKKMLQSDLNVSKKELASVKNPDDERAQKALIQAKDQRMALSGQLADLQRQFGPDEEAAAKSAQVSMDRVNKNMKSLIVNKAQLNQALQAFRAKISDAPEAQRPQELSAFAKFVSSISKFFSKDQMQQFAQSLRSMFTNIAEIVQSLKNQSVQLKRTSANSQEQTKKIAREMVEIKQQLPQVQRDAASNDLKIAVPAQDEVTLLQNQLRTLTAHEQTTLDQFLNANAESNSLDELLKQLVPTQATQAAASTSQESSRPLPTLDELVQQVAPTPATKPAPPKYPKPPKPSTPRPEQAPKEEVTSKTIDELIKQLSS